MITFFRAVARFRRPLIVGELVLAAAYSVFAHRHHGAARELGFPVAFVVGVAGFVVAEVANRRYRPVALTADPRRRAFATPAGPAQVLAFTAYLALATQMGNVALFGAGEDDDAGPGTVALAVLMAVPVAVLAVAAWRDLGVRLRPEGLEDRRPLGSLAVPWAAFRTGSPVARPAGRKAELVLAYQDRDLVRRHGVPSGVRSIGVRHVDRAFLAAVIEDYVRHPEHRAAIGSEAELRRIMPSVR